MARIFKCGYVVWNLVRPDGTVEFVSTETARRTENFSATAQLSSNIIS
jgi:hypothetical protein